MSAGLKAVLMGQKRRNNRLLQKTEFLGTRVRSKVLPLQVDIVSDKSLNKSQVDGLQGLQKEAARTAIRSLGSLAKLGELDHLGGGLELIPSLLLTLSVTDFDRVEYTIEHAHTSVGYYAALSAMGYLSEQAVVESFRRSLDIPGHVSWLPGGTQLNGGRLGVMVPVAVGQALGKKAKRGDGSWVICHCGDAGFVSGQALNGFNGADVHGAPITFIMHRNGIQLSGSTESILNKDPRAMVAAMGIEIIEIKTLHDLPGLYKAYRRAFALAQRGRPSMIYPTGEQRTLANFAKCYGIETEVKDIADLNGVDINSPVWVPGSLMSFGDVESMVECIFLVNHLPGGKGHHDGHMKGREVESVLSNPMLQISAAERRACSGLRRRTKRTVITKARPAPGTPNLRLPFSLRKGVKLKGIGETDSARAGSEAGYALVAQRHPEKVFVVSCDLDPSTKLAKARSYLAPDHQFEMSIEEQAATLMADGLAMSGSEPQLNVVSTFAAFFEGIAREGFDLWRYQRNLNGINEGLNVTFHVSHVGACTGRDHFSGWGLDWINVGLTYLPYLHRFYAPADARSAFIATCDLAEHYGGHVIGIPRDNLPILSKQDASGPLWETTDTWEPITEYRKYKGAKRAILALGAPAFLAGDVARKLGDVDVHVVNGFPVDPKSLSSLIAQYPKGVVTIEDGFIGTAETGLRGFAALIAGMASEVGCSVAHLGITDPRTAPSEGHMETWEHFGMTKNNLIRAIEDL
jgi:transketolase N-terminal domain/subunit/transketolase C-terminal domain/subunit